MKKIHRPSPGWLRYFAFSLLLIVGGLSAYGFIYVAQHKTQLDEHYLKLLLAAAEYSEDTLERLDQNVANALADKSLLNADSVGVIKKIPTSLKGIAALDPGSVSLNLTDSVLAALDVSAMNTVARRVQVIKQGKQARLRFDLARYFEQFENKIARVAAEADLHELLTPLFPREGFDAFVIAEESGDVLVYEGTGSLMLLALPLDVMLPAATHADAEFVRTVDRTNAADLPIAPPHSAGSRARRGGSCA